MLSGKLIRLIETHEEEIARNILRAVRRDPNLLELGKLPDAALRDRYRDILKNLGHWLALGNEERLAREYEAVGEWRFGKGVPLNESVRGLFLIKDSMIEFLDRQGFESDSLSLYAEEQFERRIGKFFDRLVLHLVRGYEAAWGRATTAA